MAENQVSPSEEDMLKLVKGDPRLSLGYLGQMNGLFHYDTMRALEFCQRGTR